MRTKDSLKIKIKLPPKKKRKYLKPEDISWGAIREQANQLTWRYIEEKGWKHPSEIKLDIQDMYETVIYPEYEFQLITNLDLGYHEDEKVLGKTISKDRVILIDKTIAPPTGDPRYVFTFGHECGHAIFHKGTKHYLCTEKCLYRRKVSENKGLPETQANLFSENFLMPEDLFKYKFMECYQLKAAFHYYGDGDYCFEVYGRTMKMRITSYYEFCRSLAWPLCPFFAGISKESVALKIHKLGLIKNHTTEEFGQISYQVGSILRNMMK